jgi:ABC-type sugar transport system ATPase subunit
MSFFQGPLAVDATGTLAVDTAGVSFVLDAEQAASARRHALAEITLGVRPEHIELADQFGERAAAAAFEAHVDVVEALGNETHATLLVGGRAIITRLPPDAAIRAGETQRFAIAPQHLLLFDPASGGRLE